MIELGSVREEQKSNKASINNLNTLLQKEEDTIGKKQKEMKAKATKIVVKEVRFGPNTDEHDFNFKLNHAKKFLQEGSKVKAFVFFKGRSILFKDKGEILLLKFAAELEEYGKPENLPELEGKRMIMFLSPKKKK